MVILRRYCRRLIIDSPSFCSTSGVVEDKSRSIYKKTKEEIQYDEKKAKLYDKYGLKSADKQFGSSMEKITALLAEGRQKGYTILPVHNGHEDGYVLFIEVDGIELAYNPIVEKKKC